MRKPKSVNATGLLSQAKTMRLPLSEANPIAVRIGERPKEEAPLYDVHSACELGLVLTGEYLRIYEGLARRVRPGQIWLCGVWEPHGHQTLKTPTRAMVVTFLLDFLWGEEGVDAPWGRLFLNHAKENREIVLAPAESRLVTSLGYELAAEHDGNRPFRLAAMRICLKKLLLPILRRSQAAPDGSATNFLRVQQVMEMVREGLPGPIHVGDACAAAGLSRTQFSAVFQRTTGVTFGEFIQRARIARAARDLAVSDAKIAAIAKKWGYTDQSHMHRVFRKFFRCTPVEYRKRSME